MVDLVPCYADRNLYIRLAKDYIKVLQGFDDQIVWDERTFLDEIWDANFIMEERTVQGFVIAKNIDFSVYPDALYIMEFYVVPEARKKGVGKAAVKDLVEGFGGDVFLYVHDRNFTAKVFWEAVGADFGWERIERPEIRKEEGTELRVYRT